MKARRSVDGVGRPVQGRRDDVNGHRYAQQAAEPNAASHDFCIKRMSITVVAPRNHCEKQPIVELRAGSA